LLVLVFFAFTLPAPPEAEQGILVNFGTDETGSGMIEPSAPAVQTETSPPQASVPESKVKEEALITQNDEEAPEVKKVDPNAEKRRLEKIEADRKLRAEAEAERIRKQQEEIERKRIEAEQQRLADITNRTKNALANARNSGTNSTSEGVAGGTGNQGVPTGSVESNVHAPGGGLGVKGISYSLGGRGFQKLPPPKYDYQGEGRVVVEVSVDRQGKVIQAVPGIKGSTTLDEYLLRVAKEAALQAQFQVSSDAPVVQKGTITYNFILK
jgi:outer membrane biosynthesis protein TonB